ncbi:hypothetical+protein [Methylocapsa aurea]|uniref:hypothetical protein n=1 Tax=Methylocapsa aurea TaxID=663610 RepID=UPI003D187B57
MSRFSSQYEYMSLDDFEERLADKPADEKWELIGGRVVRMMVGARSFREMAVYQKLPSLRHYAPVERDRAHIETFDRAGEVWSGVRILDGLAAELDLPAIGVSVPLAEIYRDVIGG